MKERYNPQAEQTNKANRIKNALGERISESVGNFLLNEVHRSVNGIESLNLAKEHVENGGSVLAYFNHFAKLDPILFGNIINEYITPFEDVAAVLSRRHVDSNRGIFQKAQAGLMKNWEDIYGFTAIPVVQEKDKKDYPDADEFNSRSAKEIIRFLRKPGHVIGLAPEGTRSKTNELLQATQGFEAILRLAGQNTIAIPMAGEHSAVIPLTTKTKISVGEPFTYEQIKTESQEAGISITDLAMRKIAALLPEQNRGYYK